MDSKRGDMGKLNMIMENIINITCGTIFKMPAHRKDKFAFMRTTTRWSAREGTRGSSSWPWRTLTMLLVASLSKCQHTDSHLWICLAWIMFSWKMVDKYCWLTFMNLSDLDYVFLNKHCEVLVSYSGQKIQKGTNRNLQGPSGTFRNLQELHVSYCNCMHATVTECKLL